MPQSPRKRKMELEASEQVERMRLHHFGWQSITKEWQKNKVWEGIQGESRIKFYGFPVSDQVKGRRGFPKKVTKRDCIQAA